MNKYFQKMKELLISESVRLNCYSTIMSRICRFDLFLYFYCFLLIVLFAYSLNSYVSSVNYKLSIWYFRYLLIDKRLLLFNSLVYY